MWRPGNGTSRAQSNSMGENIWGAMKLRSALTFRAALRFRAATWAAPTGFDRALELSRLAATEALADAGLWDGQALQTMDPERMGCTVSASKPLFLSSSRQVVGRDPAVYRPNSTAGARPTDCRVDDILRFILDKRRVMGNSKKP